MKAPIAIIGAGGWGTALAVTMARDERDVRLWAYESYLVETVIATRENPIYLPGIKIPDTVRVSNSLSETLCGAAIVLMAIPSHVVRSVLSRMLPMLSPEAVFVSAAKGIENDTLMRMSEVITDVSAARFIPKVGAISGPTFAPEVARGEPTALVVASPDDQLRLYLQSELSAPRFRLYTNSDLIGVEIAAAVKNVIAIAAGVVEGLGLGHNALAALITRGLAEITRLACALGGRRDTLAGLSGLGDLVLTCTGTLSRNRHVGVELARGRPLAEVVAGMKMVAEGVRTTGAALALGERCGVELPITEQMAEVLSGRTDVRTAVGALMVRRQRAEAEPVGPGGHPK